MILLSSSGSCFGYKGKNVFTINWILSIIFLCNSIIEEGGMSSD